MIWPGGIPKKDDPTTEYRDMKKGWNAKNP